MKSANDGAFSLGWFYAKFQRNFHCRKLEGFFIVDWVKTAEERLTAYRFPELVQAGIVRSDQPFFPVVTYPPVTMYPPATAEGLFPAGWRRTERPAIGYVHIPFCGRRCTYCHWVLMENPAEDLIDEYLDLLAAEMRLVTEHLGRRPFPLHNMIFGGGTPTYLSPRQLERVLNDLTAHFDLSACRQFSFEADPLTLLGETGATRLRLLKEAGVDRISLGVQAFADRTLLLMGRRHTVAEAREAVAQIRRAGIESVSIDLIYGYPGQTPEEWAATIATAVQWEVDAWQLYRLRIVPHGDETGEILYQYNQRPEDFPSPEKIALMKVIGNLVSEHFGYPQRFTRIFARRPRDISLWLHDCCVPLHDVIGLGLSAWGNYDRTFTMNVGHDYDAYRSLIRQGRLPVDRGLARDEDTERRRTFILPLKNDFLNKKLFAKRTGVQAEDCFGPIIERLVSFGLLERDAHKLQLTERGRFFADETVFQFFQRHYLPFPELANEWMPE